MVLSYYLYAWKNLSPLSSVCCEFFNIKGVFSKIVVVFTLVQLSNKSVSGRFYLGVKHHGGNKPYIHVRGCYNELTDVNALFILCSLSLVTQATN